VKSNVSRSRAAASDPELLARIHEGDLDALGVIYERYQHDVRRFLHRMGVPPEDLDDLVQQSFLELIRASRNFDGRCSARAWLIGVSATMARRRRRSIARAAARFSAWVNVRTGARVDTPEEDFEGREVEWRLRTALDKLSPKKREVFVMVTLEGASGDEAAVALDVPINTVWTRLHHARQELRRRLGEDRP